MELGLHFTELTCCEQTGRLVMSHEETMETAIAEYCPDMTRIVSVCGQLQIRERTALEGRVTATGTVRVTVLYTSEESAGLRSLTLPVPFSCTAEDETLASSQLLWATGRLLLAEAQAVTARKLYVRVLPEVTLTGYTRAQCRFCSGTEEDPALRVRRRDHDISLLDTAAERSFSVAQETPEVSPAPEDLLLYRLCPRLTSCRLVGSKLVLKGELALSALYRGQDQQLHTYETELPVSQILDGADLPEEGELSGILCLTGGEVRVLRSDSGGGFSISAELRLLLRAYRTVRCSCVEDLYSIRRPVQLHQETVAVPVGRPCRSLREESIQHLDFGGSRPFFFITDTDCTPAAVTEEASRFDGENTWFYFLWYGIGRFWIEGLRTDSLYLFDWTIGDQPIRVSQALSLVMVLVSAFMLFYNIKLRPHKREDLYVNIVAARKAAAAADSEADTVEASTPAAAEPAAAPVTDAGRTEPVSEPTDAASEVPEAPTAPETPAEPQGPTE